MPPRPDPKPGEHEPAGYFDADIELKPPTVEDILLWLGCWNDSPAVQRATVARAVQEEKLAPLELAELRKQGWIV
jgi:hypothetical protein